MLVVVKDACLLIDLAEADLLGLWFGLGIETYATNLVLAEVSIPAQKAKIDPFVEAKMLKQQVLTSEELIQAVQLLDRNGISLADASACFLAKKLNAPLLTGDRRLRSVAEAREVETHGLLWVFDLLVEKEILAKLEAAERLECLIRRGSRLPQGECTARIKKWRSKDSQK